MDQVDRGAGVLGKLDGLAHRFHLGLDRATRGKVPDSGAPRGVQLGGPGGDDLVVLGVDGDHRPRPSGRSQEKAVVVAPLSEPWGDHEDLEPGVSVAHHRGDLGAGRLARIRDDDVKSEVGEGSFGVASPPIDATPERTVLLVDHRRDGGHAAGDRSTRAVLEVVEGRERRRRGEMRVEIDAPREHDLALRIDITWRRTHLTDRADALARYRDVGVTRGVWGDDEAAAYR